MKILFSSDWQATLSNLDRCEAALEQVLSIITRESIDQFVHLGDIKEQFNNIDVRVLNFAVGMVKRVRAAGVPVWIVPGNHDYISPTSPVHFLPALAEAGAHVFSEPAVTGWNGKASIWVIPYLRAAEDNDKAFKFVTKGHLKENRHLLLFHNEVEGAEYRGSVHSKGALKLPWKQFDICIGGHIHRQQNIPGTNIWYVGSPFCCTWGEANESKGYLIWDSERPKTVKPVPSTIPGWYDPALPGYRKPRSWAGASVRITVPVDYEGLGLPAARAAIESRYPGAVVNLVPELAAVPGTSKPTLTGTDSEILASYVRKLTLPPGIKAAQVQNYITGVLPAGGLLGVQGLEFEWVEAQDTLCFEKVKLNFRKGLTLVTGQNNDWAPQRSNGSGKSTLLGLISILVFGQSPKEQKHDTLIRKGAAGALISGSIILGDKRKLEIVRSRNPGRLIVKLDGKDVTMGDANATQRLIEQLTNLTWEVFNNSLYISQKEVGSVFGTEKERKELFSRLLGLERFIKAAEVFRKQVQANKVQITSKDADMWANQAALQEAQSTVEQTASRIKLEPPASASKLKQKKAALLELQTNRSGIVKYQEDLDAWLIDNQKRYEKLLDPMLDANSRANELCEQLEKIVEAGKDRICPICGSPIKGEQLNKHSDELESRIKQYHEQYNNYERMCEQNRNKRKEPYRRTGEAREQIHALDKQIAQTELDIQSLEFAAETRRKLAAEHAAQLKRVADLELAAQSHAGARGALVEHETFLNTCLQVVNRDGLPAYLAELVAPQLNAAATRYSIVFSGGEIGLHFKIADGDIDVEVVNQHGGESFKDQSMGETRMAGLIAAFAFREGLVPHNLLILDEPSEGFDADNARSFAEGLSSVVERFGTVFLTTHNEHILNSIQPDYHVKVVKTGGVSKVEEL